MAVGPIGNAIFVNQMTPAVTPVQGGQYTRYELQNIAAQMAVQEKQQEVEEIRPAEENHAVDPDREHTHQEADEEMSDEPKTPRETKSEEEAREIEKEEGVHLLDIKV
ncbi:hypothetical protein MNB_SM-6-1209 [hydrothermal vent metagenome]|uniref:Uncharacterized protein n=1 Tax=hydrothermal vent metagenome TaxID=652676 RepID=A0A1W1CC90_9ZZZZ